MVKAGRGGVCGGAEAMAERAAAEQDAAPDYHTAHVAPPSHHRLTAPERMVITTLDGRGHALDLDQRACGREGRRDAGDIIPLTCTDQGRSQDDAGGQKGLFFTDADGDEVARIRIHLSLWEERTKGRR